MKKFVLVVPLVLFITGCSLFQSSEPIDVELANQLVHNAELMQKDMTTMADTLDAAKAGTTGWDANWSSIERASILLVAGANLEVAKEAQANAKAKNNK